MVRGPAGAASKHGATFFEVNKTQPARLYEFAKGWLTGTTPDIDAVHTLEQAPRPVDAGRWSCPVIRPPGRITGA